MRLMAHSLAALILLSQCNYWSCDAEHDSHDHEDVSVDITGAAGLDFDAHFEDDHRSQDVSGQVPFTADFQDQEDFFQAIVDKNSSGSESICVELTTPHASKKQCATDPHARLSITLFF